MSAVHDHRDVRRRIIVAGYMLRFPLAGNVFAYLHYLLGLHRLGYDVAYVEDSGGWGFESCYDPATKSWGSDPSAGLKFLRTLLDQHGFGHCSVCYIDRHSGQTWGIDRAALLDLIDRAELLLNLGGICWLDEFKRIPRRAMVDMDPFFTQTGQFGSGLLANHNIHFTYGMNVGHPSCTVPERGFHWIGTVPPVVTSLWSNFGPPCEDAPFTSIASWNAYGGTTWEGEYYGQKGQELLKLMNLPRCSKRRLELALAGADDIADKFRSTGWSIYDAGPISAAVHPYQQYIGNSYGELSAAKHAYVKSRSGWFSDRSVCYLAAGRPVVVQDTGFGDHIPQDLNGHGILTFSTPEQATTRLHQLEAEYPTHQCAAQELVQRIFAHDVVLPRLIDLAFS